MPLSDSILTLLKSFEGERSDTFVGWKPHTQQDSLTHPVGWFATPVITLSGVYFVGCQMLPTSVKEIFEWRKMEIVYDSKPSLQKSVFSRFILVWTLGYLGSTVYYNVSTQLCLVVFVSIFFAKIPWRNWVRALTVYMVHGMVYKEHAVYKDISQITLRQLSYGNKLK